MNAQTINHSEQILAALSQNKSMTAGELADSLTVRLPVATVKKVLATLWVYGDVVSTWSNEVNMYVWTRQG